MTRTFSFLLATLLAPGSALAHAVLLDSIPAPESHVKPGQVAILCRYNSRIDASRSKLTLSGSNGSLVRLATRAGDGPDKLAADAHVSPGAYVLHWQVLAVDGHITRGNVPFTVDAR